MSTVLVVPEQKNDAQKNGALGRISLEVLAAGQALARSIGAECAAAVLGESSTAATELTSKALTRVYTLEHPLLKQYTPDGYNAALEQLIRKTSPAFVLFPHTYQVRDFAPALAARFGQSLISDVVALREGPTFVRQLFQGKLNADYRCTTSEAAPGFVSVQAGSFRIEDLQPGTAPTEAFAIELSAEQIRTAPGEPFRESAQTVDLGAAQVIVSVGRGIREQENMPIVEALAQALGAELAASRPICDAGWLPIERQVGSSGHTVAPKLYLAVGISGAIQHLVGMKGSKAVIAINKDENAPIFEVADYGVVGDLFEIVPELTRAITAAKS
jgi:electron transfer flavoprotein alpha subunit